MKNTPNPTTFVTTVDIKIAEKMKADLYNQGFELSTPPHTIFSAKKKGVSCTLYQSGKLMVQGKDMAEFMEFYLEPHVLQSFTYTYDTLDLDQSPRIGIDESGKGDFFGPLCIAGVYAGGEDVLKLKKLGAKDSKDMSDSSIHKVAKAIRAEFQHHIVQINPLKYNELYSQFKNLNHLLAWGHATTIEQLVSRTNCKKVIIDQFANENVVITALKRKSLKLDLTQRHKAEEDVVVAAASILARETFLNGLAKLSKECGIALPKGASSKTIEAARAYARKFGKQELGKVAKLHFKTLDAIEDS